MLARGPDAKRGQLFSKLSRAIIVAAREGGGDPEMNPTLRTMFQKARDASVPIDTIERAIKRSSFKVLQAQERRRREHQAKLEQARVDQLLGQARALGASLVVALNTDASVKRLGKEGDRPVNPLADRVAVIAALEAVTLVTWFDADTPLELIVGVRPDVLAKGGDWKAEDIVGARQVEESGGKVYSIPFAHARSTTSLLAKIRTPS